MSEFENDVIRPDARLIILRALKDQNDERLNSGIIELELRRFGIDRQRDWIHDELNWLAQMGAVVLTKAGTIVVAALTEKGAAHLRRAVAIEGVKRPSRPGV